MKTNLNDHKAIDWQSNKVWRIASIGECMIELCESPELKQDFAGDTMSTAVYLMRELANPDHDVDYLTVLGNDPFSKKLLEVLEGFGIGVDLIAKDPTKMLGLYWVRTDETGERSFYYWRDDAAAKRLMNCLPEAKLVDKLSKHQMIYLSGITLAILPDKDRSSLLKAVTKLHHDGCVVAFDSNYRPALWGSSVHASEWIARFLRVSNLALVSFGDEKAMFGDSNSSETLARIQAYGVTEVVVKNGASACHFACNGKEHSESHVEGIKQVDSTAAGDSFNGAYIAARINGFTAAEAVKKGHQLAAKVVQHHGAITPELSSL